MDNNDHIPVWPNGAVIPVVYMSPQFCHPLLLQQQYQQNPHLFSFVGSSPANFQLPNAALPPQQLHELSTKSEEVEFKKTTKKRAPKKKICKLTSVSAVGGQSVPFTAQKAASQNIQAPDILPEKTIESGQGIVAESQNSPTASLYEDDTLLKLIEAHLKGHNSEVIVAANAPADITSLHGHGFVPESFPEQPSSTESIVSAAQNHKIAAVHFDAVPDNLPVFDETPQCKNSSINIHGINRERTTLKESLDAAAERSDTQNREEQNYTPIRLEAIKDHPSLSSRASSSQQSSHGNVSMIQMLLSTPNERSEKATAASAKALTQLESLVEKTFHDGHMESGAPVVKKEPLKKAPRKQTTLKRILNAPSLSSSKKGHFECPQSDKNAVNLPDTIHEHPVMRETFSQQGTSAIQHILNAPRVARQKPAMQNKKGIYVAPSLEPPVVYPAVPEKKKTALERLLEVASDDPNDVKLKDDSIEVLTQLIESAGGTTKQKATAMALVEVSAKSDKSVKENKYSRTTHFIPAEFQLDDSESNVFDLIHGRLSLASNPTKYYVTVDEMRRRIQGPEKLNSSSIAGNLRRPKMKNGGELMRAQLRDHNIHLLLNTRQAAYPNKMISICEGEVANLVSDLGSLVLKDYPRERIAEEVAKEAIEDVNFDEKPLKSATNFLKCMQALESAMTSVVPPLTGIKAYASHNEKLNHDMEKFSGVTHGFGILAQRTWLRQMTTIGATVATNILEQSQPGFATSHESCSTKSGQKRDCSSEI